MKRFINQFLFASLALVMLAGCEKDEKIIYYQGGTNPVLTASSTAAMVLLEPNKNNFAIRFNWTNPNYRFTTGISSQDVTYFLQVDTLGANFTNPNMQQVSISKDLEISMTVRELNAVLTKLNVAENMLHKIEFRIKSTVGGTALPLYSNVIRIDITPYLDVALPLPPGNQLYMTGSAMASDWTNSPPVSQRMTPVASSLTSTGLYTSFVDTVSFVSGRQYKFLSTLGAWQPQYGAAPGSGYNGNGGDLGANMGSGSDPDAIPTPNDAGSYRVTVNFKTGKYTVEKL